MKEKKEKKSSGTSTRDKMLKRKKDLENRGSSNGILFPKDGVTRMRIKSPGPDAELGIEIIQFYPSQELGGIISPATFDEPCPFMEKFKELKASSDPDDVELAKRLVPRRKYVIGGVIYKDDKGKEVDPDQSSKAVMVARSVYQDIIEYYLDEEEWGDMTDDQEGYDIKIMRSGTGKMDTTYSVSPCQKKKMDKAYRGTIDLEKIVRGQIPDYDTLEATLKSFLKTSTSDDDDDEDEAPRKKKKLGDKDKKKKKKYDI